MSASGNARLLIAPQAFKGTLSARRAAAAMARGACEYARGRINLSLDICPLADGGDGSVDALVASGFLRCRTITRGATGEPGPAHFAFRDGIAAVEIARSCGLARQLPYGLDPLNSSSRGLGDAILAALEYDPDTLIVFLGGSASTDGGAGMLHALGATMRDSAGREVEPCGGTLHDIVDLELDGLDPRLRSVRVIAGTDVTSPLTGIHGAAHVFAPQKGASPDEVRVLESGMENWRNLILSTTGIEVDDVPGAGAAGGVGGAAIAFLGAHRVSGFDLISEQVDLDARLDVADAVMTGEGAFDSQSLLGKGTGRLIEQARASSTRVGLICGRLDVGPDQLRAMGVDAATELVTVDREMTRTPDSIAHAATSVAARLLE